MRHLERKNIIADMARSYVCSGRVQLSDPQWAEAARLGLVENGMPSDACLEEFRAMTEVR